MIEGIGSKGQLLTGSDMIARSPRARVTDTALPRPVAANPIARFELTSVVADIASRAPVDQAKVSELRTQIAAGSYKVDPVRIADAMLVAR